MLERGKMDRGVIELVDTESLVPQGHLLRKVDAAVNFGKLYDIVEPLYSEEEGRPSVCSCPAVWKGSGLPVQCTAP